MSLPTLDELIAKLGGGTPIMVQVGRNVISARVTAGKSIDEVAAEAGIKTDDLISIEAGNRRPTGAELVRIARSVGVLLDRFFIGL